MKATLIYNKIKGEKKIIKFNEQTLISKTYHKENFVIKNLYSFCNVFKINVELLIYTILLV